MLVVSVVVSLAMQMAILYVPVLNSIFKVVPLTALQLAICILGSSTALLIVPRKLIKRRQYTARNQAQSYT
jgi:Ca2+-transporting ATPase